jgi:PAS domain S-box-containing protein
MLAPHFMKDPDARSFTARHGEMVPAASSRARLAETCAELQELLNRVSDLVFTVNARGRLLFVNRALCEALGYSPAEAAGLNLLEIVEPARRPRVRLALDKLSVATTPVPLEVTLLTKQGQALPVKGILTLRREAGRAAGAQGAFCLQAAVLAQRDADRLAMHNRTREKQLNELQTNFISVASHELRTPLATLSLGVDFLLKYWTKLQADQIDHSLQTVHAGVQQLRAVLDDILIVGRSEEGRLACKPVQVELVAFSRKLADEVAASDLLRHPITWRCPVESCDAKVDPQLLRQVLFNLLSNACKFSAENSPVTLSLEPGEDSLTFSVTDTGIGIPADDQPNLFKLFFRAANTGRVPGSGLGLTVVRRCLDALGGTIAFESATDRGSRFIVTLPI